MRRTAQDNSTAMQIGFGSKDRRRSPNKHGAGGYYQFTFEEDLSGSEAELDLNPKEFVERALRETELDTRPVGYSDPAPLPEPDFSIHELLDDLYDYPVDPGGHLSADRYSPPGTPEQCPGTPESLHSPLDHPDSGYIEFIQPRSSSSLSSSGDNTRSPSEGFDDDFRVPCSSGNLSQSADGDLGVRKPRSLSPTGPKGNKQSLTLPQVVFHRFKSEFDRLEDDRFIDDDLLRSGLPCDPSAMEVELRDLGAKGLDLGEPGHDINLNTEGRYLPLPGEMTLEHEGDAMLDLERGPTDDNSPIICVDQTSLTERLKARRRKVTIVIAVLAGFFGLAAIGAITYLLVRFLGD